MHSLREALDVVFAYSVAMAVGSREGGARGLPQVETPAQRPHGHTHAIQRLHVPLRMHGVRPSRPADHTGVIFRGFELVQSWCGEPVVHDRWSMVHVPVSVDVYEPDERQVWQLALFVVSGGTAGEPPCY